MRGLHNLSDGVDIMVLTAWSVKVGTLALCNQPKSDGAPGGCGRGRGQGQAIPINMTVMSAPAQTQTGWLETQTREPYSAAGPTHTFEDKTQGQAACGHCFARPRKSFKMDRDHHVISF